MTTLAARLAADRELAAAMTPHTTHDLVNRRECDLCNRRIDAKQHFADPQHVALMLDVIAAAETLSMASFSDDGSDDADWGKLEAALAAYATGGE